MQVDTCQCGKEKAKFMDCCPQCQSKIVKVSLEQRVADLEKRLLEIEKKKRN